MSLGARVVWICVALMGATALSVIATHRGESINAVWFIAAAAGVYLVAYRFYASWIAARVLTIDATRATPAERLDDGRDFVPTNRWIVFGHHFAAIAGPGPLIGPTLAAQFGFLPGMLWMLVGATLGGAVHVAAQLGGEAGAALLAVSRAGFVQAFEIATAVSAAGALAAALFAAIALRGSRR